MSAVPQCLHDDRERKRHYVAKPIGTFSIAGNQPKVVAIEVEVCDECWSIMVANIAKGAV